MRINSLCRKSYLIIELSNFILFKSIISILYQTISNKCFFSIIISHINEFYQYNSFLLLYFLIIANAVKTYLILADLFYVCRNPLKTRNSIFCIIWQFLKFFLIIFKIKKLYPFLVKKKVYFSRIFLK